MNPTPLPRGSRQHGFYGALETLVGVAGYRPYSREPTGHQRAQEREPESSVLTGTHIKPQRTSLWPLSALSPMAITTASAHHLPVLACLYVGSVQPYIRVGACKLAVAETLYFGVQLFAKPTDLALTDTVYAQSLHQFVHLAGRDAMHVGFLDHRGQRPLSLPTGLQERGKVAAVSDPRNFKLHGAHPRVPLSLSR